MVFPPRHGPSGSFPGYILELFSSWFADSRHDAGLLEDTLQENFGVNCRLFDVSPNGQSGVQIGVTATAISDSKLYIFSNYNGVGKTYRKASFLNSMLKMIQFSHPGRLRRVGLYVFAGYKHLRPENPTDEVHIWEV